MTLKQEPSAQHAPNHLGVICDLRRAQFSKDPPPSDKQYDQVHDVLVKYLMFLKMHLRPRPPPVLYFR